jgi:conjugal transfer mating pair stabilization protein TraG
MTLLLALTIPAALFGADATPIYVWGFGDKIAEVFRAVSMAIDANAPALTAMAFTVGLTITGFRIAGLQGRPLEPAELVKFPVMIIVLQQVFLSNNLSPNYAVIDETTNQMHSVGELPAGIGQTFSLFSRLQRSILSVLDSAYSTPDSIGYRNAGLGFGMSIHDTISSATPVNPAVMMSFDYYVNDCLSAHTLNNPNFLINLQYSDNPMEAMRVSDNFIASYVSREGAVSVEYCPDAWTKIVGDVSAESNGYLAQLANARGYSSSDPSELQEFGDKVALVAQTYIDMSTSANDYISKAMLGNMFTQSTRTMSSLTGINAGALAFMPAYAERKAVSGMYTTGILATKYMPVMQMILTALIISVSWILVLLAIATFNMRYIATLFTLICVVFMWTIIGSVMNFIFDLWAKDAIEAVSYGVGSGYTIGLKDAIDETIGNKLALLGYMSWLTPMLAYGLVKGSDMALAGVFNAIGAMMNAPVNQSTGPSVDRSATGGHSLFNNLGITYVDPRHGSINEFSSSVNSRWVFDAGGYPTTAEATYYDGGSQLKTSNSAVMLTSVDGTVTGVNLTGMDAKHLENQTAAAQQSLQETAQNAAAKTREELFSLNDKGEFRYNEKADTSAREAYKQEFLKTFESAEALAKATGMSSEAALEIYGRASLNADLTVFGTGPKFETGVTAKGTSKGSTSEEAKSSVTDKDMERLNKAMDTAMGRALSLDVSKATTFAQSSGGKLSEAFSELKAKQESLNYAQSTSASLSKDRLIAYAQEAGSIDGEFSHKRAHTALQNLQAMSAEDAAARINSVLGSPSAISNAQSAIANTQISDNFDYGAALKQTQTQYGNAGIDYKAAFEANKERLINQGLIDKANANTIGEDQMQKLVEEAMGRGDALKGSPDTIRALPTPADEIGIKASKTVNTVIESAGKPQML